MNATQIIALAEKHANNGAVMQSSAELCLADASRMIHYFRENDAKARAIKSLAYSVGICHPDYIAATAR
jgi:hypothetical protein